MVDHAAVPVKLIGVALGAESDKDGQSAEIVNVMVDRPYAERAKVRDDHGAVEGAGVGERLGQPAEIIHNTENQNGKAEQKTGQPGQRFRYILSVVASLVGLDLVDLFVHLAVNVKNGVRRLKLDLDGGFRRTQGKTAFDCHDHFNIVPGIDAAANHKTVDTGQHGHAPDVGCDEKMEDTDPLVSVHAEPAQAAVDIGDLKAFLILVAGVVAHRHNKRHKPVKGGKGAEEPAFFSVAELTFISCHIYPSRYGVEIWF